MLRPATRPAVTPMQRRRIEPARGTWVLRYPECRGRLDTPAASLVKQPMMSRRLSGAR
jgi:hypothetical protein